MAGDALDPRFLTFRDRVAVCLANAALRLASKWYRDNVQAYIWYGMNARARDVAEGREPPESWWRYEPNRGKGMR